jgi:RimJ/RimL family protein N-acetyltransferase
MLTGFPPQSAAPTVHGERVVLCELEPRDAPAMLESDRDPETAARFGWDPAEAALWRCERYVEQAAAMWRSGERLVFAVRESPAGPLAGIVDAQLRDRPPGARTGEPAVELSWTTIPLARGRGIATDAVRALVAYCATAGVDEVWAKIDPGNAASLAVARAAGFREAGRDADWVFLSAPTTGGDDA